jgi:hypothetical protein
VNVYGLRRQQFGFAGNNRCRSLPTWLEQDRDHHQYPSRHQSHSAPSQQTCQPADLLRHDRAAVINQPQ